MHRVFRKMLKDARGVSEFIIAVNIDIRGFSSFSKKVESPETAMFIKRVYIKLIDNYFSDASFFKPTGDGLIITIPYTEENLKTIARRTVRFCFKVLREFGIICKNDPMINFEVPRKVGIGISRGTACSLVSKDTVLDYSGRVLNLASRLMDLARPSGIVFDADFGIELLLDEQIKLFAKDNIYIKGIAEREPIRIFYTKKLTRISPLNKHPLDKIKWNTIKDTRTLKQIKDLRPTFMYEIQTQPIDSSEIAVKISYPGVLRGRKQEKFKTILDFINFEYYLEAGKPRLNIDYNTLAEKLEKRGVKDSWKVNIEIIYPEK